MEGALGWELGAQANLTFTTKQLGWLEVIDPWRTLDKFSLFLVGGREEEGKKLE